MEYITFTYRLKSLSTLPPIISSYKWDRWIVIFFFGIWFISLLLYNRPIPNKILIRSIILLHRKEKFAKEKAFFFKEGRDKRVRNCASCILRLDKNTKNRYLKYQRSLSLLSLSLEKKINLPSWPEPKAPLFAQYILFGLFARPDGKQRLWRENLLLFLLLLFYTVGFFSPALYPQSHGLFKTPLADRQHMSARRQTLGRGELEDLRTVYN